MNTTINHPFSAGAAERLMKSADSLDFALQGATKKSATAATASLYGNLFDATDLSATLFDDWLANDLQHVGFINQDDPSSMSASDLDSNHSDSPVVGFDSIASDIELIQTTEFNASMALFPEAQQQSASNDIFGLGASAAAVVAAAPSAAAASMMPLTPEAVQQAAAALNIPWSKSLETAVLAQSLLASLPLALQMPVKATPAPVASAPQTTSPSPVLLPKRAETPVILERAASTTPSSTPRLSLSILSSTQTPVPGTSSVTATTYKSAYRSASLTRNGLKRDREYSEPPSVLDGRDLSGMDEVALKRAKNTDAARRSRHKKLVKMEGLEQRVAELEVENSMFETKLNEVELERSLLADKDHMQQARIQELERMLATAREKLY
ncbi:hypothetical protein BG011_003158 [Mortierella polycephala]|uniref:BZIP domain-containing protein n=1 Tax=Mortierella polycephala TaxID=41804 RepID=A0A9P6Q3M8_9FUNG|nr:hypothetical protein BG011_003158 [Mortierella polycephala]